jgi:hypothetical protein
LRRPSSRHRLAAARSSSRSTRHGGRACSLPVRRRLRPRQSACPAADSGVYPVLQLASARRSRRPTSAPPSRASDHFTTPNRIRLSCREFRVCRCIPLHRKSASCFVRGACCSLSVCCPLVPVPAAISFPHPFPLPCPCCPIHATSPLPLFCRSVETADRKGTLRRGEKTTQLALRSGAGKRPAAAARPAGPADCGSSVRWRACEPGEVRERGEDIDQSRHLARKAPPVSDSKTGTPHLVFGSGRCRRRLSDALRRSGLLSWLLRLLRRGLRVPS